MVVALEPGQDRRRRRRLVEVARVDDHVADAHAAKKADGDIHPIHVRERRLIRQAEKSMDRRVVAGRSIERALPVNERQVLIPELALVVIE